MPMLPYTVVSGVLDVVGVDRGGGQTDGGEQAPDWETVLINIGFVGMAVGLAVALPIYMRERWPTAFLGRVGEGRARSSKFVPSAMTVTAALGLLWL
ncbi:hypothetical protein [Actinomadura sp. HBU206391]|uniref:hypothetical protein n=1 Tax=Actinomadura sp. HBU206391 TaxID=2731692 RepID=UPI00164FE131|nr:hypothetical protein [Actinomadura sp. HBU206391]MBC6462756.1 hypothetical protein [Actinomadura sp. HBU206391]